MWLRGGKQNRKSIIKVYIDQHCSSVFEVHLECMSNAGQQNPIVFNWAVHMAVQRLRCALRCISVLLKCIWTADKAGQVQPFHVKCVLPSHTLQHFTRMLVNTNAYSGVKWQYMRKWNRVGSMASKLEMVAHHLQVFGKHCLTGPFCI